MKGDPEERAVQIGRYLVQSGATVRAAAQVFGVLLYNKAQRHLRGGEATRCKYLHAQHNHAD